MHILLINVPHPSIGSRIPDDHLPPLGLLSIGGPLIDDGHEVRLIDGEFGPMSRRRSSRRRVHFAPDAVLFGHSGSTSGHPVIADIAAAIAAALPLAADRLWRRVPDLSLARDSRRGTACHRDRARRGRGDRAPPDACARRSATTSRGVAGIAYRDAAGTPRDAAGRRDPRSRRLPRRLGADRPCRYSYWGGLRAVVVQFSRGCPHLCNYCGQRGFWTRWRHRDPVRFAKEIARLHREHGVKVINFADENPTVSKKAWRDLPRSADRGECRPDPGRLDPRRRHRARRRYPASLQEGRLAALPARHGKHRREDARADPQGRHHHDRPRGDPPDAPARHPVDGDLGGRLRGRDRSRPLARSAPAAVLRSRPDPAALCHAAPLDAVFPARRPSAA